MRGADFRRIFREGRRVSTPRLVVLSSERPGGGPGRYGVAVSKKFGSAVERNRVRRQVRAAVNLAGGPAPEHDFVISPKAGTRPTVAALTGDLWEIMEAKRGKAREDAR